MDAQPKRGYGLVRITSCFVKSVLKERETMTNIRYCSHIMSDGHRCNAPFRTRTTISSKRFCDEHETISGKQNRRRKEASMIEKSNFLDKIMPVWDEHETKVKELQSENKLLKERIMILEDIVREDGLGIRKKIQQIIREETSTNKFKDIVEGIIVKRLKKTLYNRGEEE
jgi:hypothetical protein